MFTDETAHLSKFQVVLEHQYGNFDIASGFHFTRAHRPKTTCHAPCNIPYAVPILIGC